MIGLGIWDAIKETIKSAIGSVDGILTGLFGEDAATIIESIALAIGLVTGALKLYSIYQAIVNTLAAIWGVEATLGSVATAALGAAFSFLTSPITLIIAAIAAVIAIIILLIKNWDTVSEALSKGWEWIKEKATSIFNGIKDTIANVFNTIKNTITTIWNNIVNTISNVWKTIVSKVKEGVSGAWNAITSVFSKISGWFKEQFTKAWQAVKNIFSTGGKIFDGIKDGIVTAFKSVVNAIINGINKVISIPFNAINNVLNGIRNINILGVAPFTWIHTFNVPQIPQLATGNVAYEPLFAMFGEYSGASNNPEITTPQNIMRETFEDVLTDFSFNNNDGQPINLSVYVGNQKLGQILLEDLRNMKRQTGQGIEALVGG